MSRKTDIAKQVISPPGDTIQETLDEIGMSQAELAERTGRPKEKINDMIKGREPISTATAFQLEKVLGIPAGIWLNREKEYRKRLFELEQEDFLEHCLEWFKQFPIRELKKLQVLPGVRDKPQLVNSLLSFFGVATPAQWQRIYLDEEVSVAFRISLANTQSPHAISAWLRMGEISAKKLNVGDFDRNEFKAALKNVKELAYEHPQNFAELLQEICAKCGVALVYVPQLSKAPINGATRWFNDRPLLQLTDRYKKNDIFWFNFYHEAGHILLHGKKDVFLENVKGLPVDEEKEAEADKFASNWLLKKSELNQIIKNENLDDEMILHFAKKFRTPAGVIIGRLQHEKLIRHSEGNHLRQKIDLFERGVMLNTSEVADGIN